MTITNKITIGVRDTDNKIQIIHMNSFIQENFLKKGLTNKEEHDMI